MQANPIPGDAGWAEATCYEGIVGLYHQFAEQQLYDYAVLWAEHNNWDLLGPPDTRFADNQVAGQVYLELYQYEADPNRIAATQTSIDAMVASTKVDDWYWIDAIQMALPLFAKFGELYGDAAYYHKGWDLFQHIYSAEGGLGLYADNGNYNFGAYLWFRDQWQDPPHRSPNDRHVFWSRGNGWVFAGLIRTLQHMQPSDPHYDDYLRIYLEMAGSLKDRQEPSGFWPVNLDDPHHARTVDPNFVDSPETSGTAFFVYGMAWGVRNGLLDEGEFGPAVVTGWNGLTTVSVQSNGLLGWCQKGAVRPEDQQPIDALDTVNFCVGAFLLAASEVAQLACGAMPLPAEIVGIATVP